MPAVSDNLADPAVNPHRPPKNIWDVLFMPLGVATAWLLLAWPIFYARQIGMPSDAFMRAPASEFSFLVLVLGVGVASIGPGLLLANSALWLVPPLREQQDKLCHGKGKEVFERANQGLLRFSLAIFLVAYPFAFAAGLDYFALAPNGVHYRPFLSVRPKLYSWNEVKQIKSKCYTAKSPNGQYEIFFSDGRSVNLAAYSERDFFAAYPRLSASLQQASAVTFYFDDDASVSCPASWVPYFATRPGRPKTGTNR
jgi:hypothetical protein